MKRDKHRATASVVPRDASAPFEDAPTVPELSSETTGRLVARMVKIKTCVEEALELLSNRDWDEMGLERAEAGVDTGSDEDNLESAPRWVRQAYERAKKVTEPTEQVDTRELRGRLIRNRLMLALKKQNLTQSALADRLGKSRSQISRILGNPERCQVRTLQAIADALDTSLSDIFRTLDSLESED